MKTSRFITILIITLTLGFYSYSKLKEKPFASTCYAAYDYWEGDILVKLLYRDYAVALYKKHGSKDARLINSSLSGSKMKFRLKNEIWKASDFLACHIRFQGSEYKEIEKEIEKLSNE